MMVIWVKTFLCSSSVYSCYLFSISSANVRYLPFLSFILPIFSWNVSLISSVFLKRSLAFPIILFSSVALRFSFKKALSLHAVFWNSAFSWAYLFLSPLPFANLSLPICEAFSDNHFAFLHFFFFVIVLDTASCTALQTSVHSAICSSYARTSFIPLG